MLPTDDPRHGTNAGYVAGCRQDACRKAHARDRKRYRDRAYINRGPLTTDGTGTRRRIQALMALGWSSRELDKRLGHNPTYTYKILASTGPIHLKTATAYAALYDQLCMATPTSDDPNLAAVIRRNRRKAAAKGFSPPLAWDNIDDPDEVPAGTFTGTTRDRQGPSRDSVDHARIERLIGGDWTLAPIATRGEREVVRARWTGTLNDLERLTGWRTDRYGRTEGAA